MRQAGVTALHFIEKLIETEKLRVSSTFPWLESAEMGWGLSTLGPLLFLPHFPVLVHESPGQRAKGDYTSPGLHCVSQGLGHPYVKHMPR